MVTKQQALDYHFGTHPGKIEVIPTKPCRTQRDLSLAYTPGVADPCLEIEKNPHDAFKYTARGNLGGGRSKQRGQRCLVSATSARWRANRSWRERRFYSNVRQRGCVRH